MNKIKVGITGQSGFIGTHLYNSLNLYPEEFELIWFEDSYFNKSEVLSKFTFKCDYIVHLAAINRHHNPNEIYKKNLELVDKLIKALSKSGNNVHVIFSSSIQEERENVYGRSKREGRRRLTEWAKQNQSGFTGLIIPNVFGPFCRPFYNSVISTFSYQLNNEESPKLESDAELKLLYVGELVDEIKKIIKNGNKDKVAEYKIVDHSKSIKVSDILAKLIQYKEEYSNKGIIPSLYDNFDINLFNTFRSYLYDKKHFPFEYKVNKDDRGIFVEAIKMNSGGQVSFSTTAPAITRGNHFHTRKIERFAVIKGEALIQLRKIGTKEVINLNLNSSNPSFVDMPIWYTHNITNVGDTDLYTLFWINEPYNPNDTDTFFENVILE